jgi:hypothetical protein
VGAKDYVSGLVVTKAEVGQIAKPLKLLVSLSHVDVRVHQSLEKLGTQRAAQLLVNVLVKACAIKRVLKE